MCNMVTNVCMKFNYDRLRIDKALGNFPKSQNSNNKNNLRSAWGLFRVQKLRAYRVGQKK